MKEAMQTQDLKTAFLGEGAVIHEVDEENHPEEVDQSEQKRHTLMKIQKDAVQV